MAKAYHALGEDPFLVVSEPAVSAGSVGGGSITSSLHCVYQSKFLRIRGYHVVRSQTFLNLRQRSAIDDQYGKLRLAPQSQQFITTGKKKYCAESAA
jgi:hypothetical protein